jgi:hypothetical protein
MSKQRALPCSRLAFVTGALLTSFPLLAPAQLGSAFPGFYSLPQSDFTWLWGDPDERDFRRRPDIQASGNESSFTCELSVRFSPSVNMTSAEEREMERALATSLAFIRESVELLNSLEYNVRLDWGRLACTKFVDDADEAELQERTDRALEKAIRDRERRRARDAN